MTPETTTRVVAGGLIVAAIGAMLVAGIRGLMPDDPADLEKPRFLMIQEIFEGARGSLDCSRIDSALAALEPFIADTSPLPPSQAETVNFPRRKVSPTIGDFAIDRRIRLKTHRAQQCP
ncbi:MAG: hypothetical protein OEV30_06595 [Ignavibacteria bacterium]|nr:hypothetical protein [Ignavibacteria bacterium]